MPLFVLWCFVHTADTTCDADGWMDGCAWCCVQPTLVGFASYGTGSREEAFLGVFVGLTDTVVPPLVAALRKGERTFQVVNKTTGGQLVGVGLPACLNSSSCDRSHHPCAAVLLC